jgi:ABC-type transport system substrate-binding protein
LPHHFNVIYEMAKELISRRIKKTGINDDKQTHNLTLALAALTVSSAVAAKTLVYCSEGSPENFNPQLIHLGNQRGRQRRTGL